MGRARNDDNARSTSSNRMDDGGRSHGSLFFFFQAEDGIRDYKVTGVQTCALPILGGRPVETYAAPSGLAVDRASSVRAAVDGTNLRVDWKGIAAARAYHVQVVDLEIGRASCRERV